ncbi:hypothetical protein PV327_000832 [Microctonus hyperodae]|uniref:Aminopeptidase N n=1 Tax=Microctonus hyperodae TaxID=165561 RepID=A0AA39L2K0_MICHY|nr:hypothetical protein PV327_000832 [Microctonus hyperodae]
MRKIDLIVAKLPMAYSALANCGFLTFKDYTISTNEHLNSNSRLEFVTQIMAHELAHQWFGCLISTASQKYEWLNEGIQPTWRMMDKFVTENIQSTAFIYDSKTNSHYIEWHDSDSFNINIYRKAGAVIRMISFILGEEKFKIALRNYVKTKAFRSVTSNDFFKVLTNVYTGNINLMNALENWVTTPGYAVITVKRDWNTGKAIITQSRFLKNTNQKSNEKYWIPINFVTEDNLNFMDTNVTHWFDPSKNSIEIDQLKRGQFVIFNKQLFGYYRVNYDNQNWELIINYLKNKNYYHIHVLNRAQLIDDAFNLAKVRQLYYKVVLSLLTYLEQETDIIPWSAAWRVIKEMYNLVGNTEIDKYFKKYVLELSEKLEQEVLSDQFDKTDVMAESKKINTLKETCFFGSSLCRSEAMRKLYNWLDNPETHALSSNEKSWILCAGLQNANQTLWDKLWDTYWITKDFEIIFALSCPSDAELLKRFLVKSIKDPTFSRFSATLLLITDDKFNGVNIALDFINKHYNEIIALDGYTNDDMQYEIENLAKQIKNKVQRDKLEMFLETNKASINNADNIIAAVDKRLENIDNLLRDYKHFFEKNMTKNSGSLFV